MAHILTERVADTTSTTGTGALSLDGADLRGFQNFDDVCANGDTIYYSIAHRTLDQWEVGLGTFGAGANTLTRTSVLSSSNSGSAVNFSSGAKDIVGSVPASALSTIITGNADTVTWANEASDTTCFIGFATAASGSLAPKTNTNMTFNSLTGVATFASTVLTTTDINGGTVDGVTIGGSSAGAITGTTITATTSLRPSANDGAALGASGTAFSDLFLASGGVINWAAANAALTHSSGRLRLGPGAFVVDNDNVFAGVSAPDVADDLLTVNEGNVSVGVASYGGGGVHGGFRGYKAGGTAASPTATQAGDILCFLGGKGYQTATSAWSTGSVAYVALYAKENFTNTAQGTYLTLETTPIGSATRAEIVRVDSTGFTGFGETSPTARVHATYAGTVQFRGINTDTSGASSGGFISLYENDGAAMSSGDRLGGVLIGGATDTSNSLNNSVAIVGFATETWSGSTASADLAFELTPTGTLTRSERMRLTSPGNLKVGGTAARGTTEGTHQLALFNGTAPAGTLSNGFSFYSSSGAAWVMDATGVPIKLSGSAPVTKTGDWTQGADEHYAISNRAATNTVTLPTASSFTGRKIYLKTIQAQTVVSASANVVPSTSATAGTAILPATDGAWALLVSDGTNWIIMAANPLV
jgi:hypothetical protein